MPLILGSKSPRRAEILNYFQLDYRILPSPFDEKSHPLSHTSPQKYVTELATEKALALKGEASTTPVLTADTIVFFNDRIFNKPESLEESYFQLRELSGNWHSVMTAVTLYYRDAIWTEVEKTEVQFLPLSKEQIILYSQGVGSLDKAGGYAIQGKGGIIISQIKGCYYNVMGLPINCTNQLLQKVGIHLWDSFV